MSHKRLAEVEYALLGINLLLQIWRDVLLMIAQSLKVPVPLERRASKLFHPQLQSFREWFQTDIHAKDNGFLACAPATVYNSKIAVSLILFLILLIARD